MKTTPLVLLSLSVLASAAIRQDKDAHDIQEQDSQRALAGRTPAPIIQASPIKVDAKANNFRRHRQAMDRISSRQPDVAAADKPTRRKIKRDVEILHGGGNNGGDDTDDDRRGGHGGGNRQPQPQPTSAVPTPSQPATPVSPGENANIGVTPTPIYSPVPDRGVAAAKANGLDSAASKYSVGAVMVGVVVGAVALAF